MTQNVKYCDLHTHSNYSDGSDSPAELVAKAKNIGLSAIALCDHNNLDGNEEFMETGKALGIETVAGVEISADCMGKELHILGLFVDKESFAVLKELTDTLRTEKESSNYRLYQNLKSAGYNISYERITEAGDKASINRVHFAKELIRCGYIQSLDEGFDTLLSKKSGYYVPPKRIDALELIWLLRSLGVVSVLAHPFLKMGEEELIEFIPKARGLSGMETNYSAFTKAQTERALSIAEQNGLLKSGGSDYHGKNKPRISLGTGEGNLLVPFEYYEKLKEHSLAIKP